MLDAHHQMDYANDSQLPEQAGDAAGAMNAHHNMAVRADGPGREMLTERSTYRRARGGDSAATIAALILTFGTLSAFAFMSPHVAQKLKREPTVVTMLELPDDPPPATPEQPPQPDTPPPTAQVTAPVPQITLAERPVIAAPPVIQPISVPTPPAPAPAPAISRTPENKGDLSAQVVFRKPIKVPLESRRQHEEGIVVLAILLATDGHVQDIAISSSSGFPRLDRAALDAVRDWRWSPTMRDGAPVMVRGLLKVPFIREGGGRPGRHGHRSHERDGGRDEALQTDTI